MAIAPAGSSSLQRPQRTPHIHYGDPDNSGTTAWRRNEEPRGKVPIPMNADIGGAQAEGARVARETGTHIELSHRARTYQIWGDSEKVNKAMSQLGKKTSAVTPSRSKAHSSASSRGRNTSVPWAKVHSPTTMLRQIQQDQLDAEEVKKHYQRNPLPEDVFESIVRPEETI